MLFCAVIGCNERCEKEGKNNCRFSANVMRESNGFGIIIIICILYKYDEGYCVTCMI